MKVILHIGTPKTGTSSIQMTCHRNRAALEKRGILYPKLDNLNRHSILSVPFHSNSIPREFWQRFGRNKAQVDQVAYEFWQHIFSEIRANTDADTVVISGEQFFQVDDIEGLKAFLTRELSGCDIEILCYLRNPADYYLSNIQQVIKASSDVPRPTSVNWVSKLRKWAEIGTLSILEFNRKTLVGQDIVHDFFNHIGFGDIKDGDIKPVATNTSMSTEAMFLMQAFRQNVFEKQNNVFNPESTHLLKVLTSVGDDLPAHLSPTRPKLRAAVYAQLCQASSKELCLLRDELGFTFADASLYKPTETVPGELTSTLRLCDILDVDQDRLLALCSKAFAKLL